MCKRHWPAVEQLEDRWAPAIISATTTANDFDALQTVTISDLANAAVNPDGLISLREAIPRPTTLGDQITLELGATYQFSTPDNYWYGPNALPEISSDITIDGNRATLLRDPFTLTTSDRPADVAVRRPGEKEARRLTRLNDSLLGHKTLGAVEEIRYKSSHDGRMIHG